MKKTALLLALLLVLTTLFGCGQKDDSSVRVYTLNGTTGFGMAKLMEDYSAKENFQFTVKSDASDVTAALINGDADMGALPTNAAANLYNVTGGEIQILAVNTKGCLYLLSTGERISTFEELRGKTVYVPAQNPTFLFTYLCKANGLTPGTDITVDSTSYAAAANLKDAVATGIVEFAVLPEPMVTVATVTAQKSGIAVNPCMDLTVEWEKVAPAGSLVQGCLVVRKDFLETHESLVKDFLKDYESSVSFLNQNPKEASELIVKHGIFTNATVAEKAIPYCNVCFLSGNEMKTAMENYLQILYGINEKAVGGKLPDDRFYYVGK